MAELKDINEAKRRDAKRSLYYDRMRLIRAAKDLGKSLDSVAGFAFVAWDDEGLLTSNMAIADSSPWGYTAACHIIHDKLVLHVAKMED